MGTTAEKLQATLNSKNAIKTVLTQKGKAPTDVFSTYAGLIGELSNTDDATADASMILEGETAYVGRAKVTGTYVPSATNTTYDNSESGLDADNTQEAIDELASEKQNNITGAASTIAASNLTTNRALISNGSGKVAVSPVTSTELGYLDGVTSNVQTQLNNKAPNSAATQSTAGLMSASDKKKLDGISSGANAYTHPTTSGNKHIPSGGSSGQILRWSADGTAEWGADNNTTYSPATQSANGLLSADDKKQLDYGGVPIVTTAGTGAAYTATVDGMTALTVGMKLTIIPHTISTNANATLNVNSLGPKYIRQRLSTNSGATAAGPAAGWLLANKPVTLMYNGTYWVAELTRSDANTIYGTTPVANGGTGKASVTSGSFLIGNGTSAMTEKTPAEVLSHIGAASVSNHQISHYYSLANLGLTAEGLSSTDFCTNIKTIADAAIAVDNCEVIKFTGAFMTTSNITKSVFAKMTTDLGFVFDSYIDIVIEKYDPNNAQVFIYPQGSIYDGYALYCRCNLSENTATAFVLAHHPDGFSENGHTHNSLTNGDYSVLQAANGNFYSQADSGTAQLGVSSRRWKTVYAVNALDTSSDIRLKTDFSTDFEKYIEMLDLINPLSFKRTNINDERRHIGYGAQYVEEAMQTVGLDTTDFAGLSKEYDEEIKDYTYGLAYEEFIPILHAKIKKQDKEIAELRKLLKELESKVV